MSEEKPSGEIYDPKIKAFLTDIDNMIDLFTTRGFTKDQAVALTSGFVPSIWEANDRA